MRYVRCSICDTPLCWWCCSHGSGCADSPATQDLHSKHRICRHCFDDNNYSRPWMWSATALDLDFARAHRALEDEGLIVIMKAGDGEALQWRRFVATFDHMTLLNVLGPQHQGVYITTVGVVLQMLDTMVQWLGIRRSGGHADSLTADYGLLFTLSDRDWVVYMTFSRGKRTWRIPRAHPPWQRAIFLPVTKAMSNSIREQYMRG